MGVDVRNVRDRGITHQPQKSVVLHQPRAVHPGEAVCQLEVAAAVGRGEIAWIAGSGEGNRARRRGSRWRRHPDVITINLDRRALHAPHHNGQIGSRTTAGRIGNNHRENIAGQKAGAGRKHVDRDDETVLNNRLERGARARPAGDGDRGVGRIADTIVGHHHERRHGASAGQDAAVPEPVAIVLVGHDENNLGRPLADADLVDRWALDSPRRCNGHGRQAVGVHADDRTVRQKHDHPRVCLDVPEVEASDRQPGGRRIDNRAGPPERAQVVLAERHKAIAPRHLVVLDALARRSGI